MCHGSHQLSVLENGAAAHALHNAAGNFQQFRIGDADRHVAGAVCAAVVDFLQRDVIGFRRVAGNGAEDLCGSGLDLLLQCHGNGFFGRRIVIQRSENAAAVVAQKFPQRGIIGKAALQHAGTAGNAFGHL